MGLGLVRHGETEANITGLYNGHIPTPLTERGIAQAQALGTLLRDVPIDNVLYSELERIRHTTQSILGDREVPARNMPELNETLFGDRETRHHRDLAREGVENYAVWCDDGQSVTPTNGKGFQVFSQRVERFVAQLIDHRTCQNLLVVSHQGVLGVLIARLLSMSTAAIWRLRVEQGCGSAIDFYDDFAVLKMLNSRAVWRDGEGKPYFFCRRASLPLTPHNRLLFFTTGLFPPFRALQKLFYKNGGAFCGVGWDDNTLQKHFRRHLFRYRLGFRYTGRCL